MISDHLSHLLSQSSLEECWTIHAAKMAEFGFDRVIYGYTRYRTSDTLGDPQDALILTNHDPAYVEFFMNEEAFRDGPMVTWAAQNSGSCSWAMMGKMAREGKLSPAEMQVLAKNQELGVTAGYTVSFHDVSLAVHGAMGLAGAKGLSQKDVDRIWKKHSNDIHLACEVFHLKVKHLPHTTGQRRALTKRQREVLEWVADGKTIQDIGIILDLNPATVEKHLRLARETLEVDTTAQAILKASSQNQFFLIRD